MLRIADGEKVLRVFVEGGEEEVERCRRLLADCPSDVLFYQDRRHFIRDLRVYRPVIAIICVQQMSGLASTFHQADRCTRLLLWRVIPQAQRNKGFTRDDSGQPLVMALLAKGWKIFQPGDLSVGSDRESDGYPLGATPQAEESVPW